jgi:NAD(P)-dependent dehydrogenase (short-subunit alcohol dehydrogenase family)
MGLVTAKAFAEAGAAVALVDVQEDAVRSVTDELAASGHRTIDIRCNVVDESDVAAMVEQTVSTSDAWTPRSTMLAYNRRRSKPRMSLAKNSIG